MAADGATREALHTLFEAAASGRLDLCQAVQRAPALLPPEAEAPWLPVRFWEVSRVLRRTPVHAVITGAAKAMAVMRAEHSAAGARGGKGSSAEALAASGGAGGSRIASALAKAVAQRKQREEHCDPSKGTGLPPHKIAPSAVHIIAGLGFRFVTEHRRDEAAGGALVAAEYRDWGGDRADVILTFPQVRDSSIQEQSVDCCAYVPRPGAHTAFIPTAILGDCSRSEAAKARVVPGNELTSTQTEKDCGRVLEFLLKAGVHADAGDADNVTALHLAVRFGLLFLLRKLLLRGANPALTDSAGNTALHYAHAFTQGTAADIITEATRGDDGKSVLEAVANKAGLLPHKVQGHGLLILPDSKEKALLIPRAPKRSGSLGVTAAI